MKRLKVGILGQGRSGRAIHADSLSRMPELFEIAAVADPLPDRCESARRAFGCDAYPSLEGLLGRGDLDLIVNATPSHLHVPLTAQILDAGFNVLCEKPLARRAAEVDRLIARARRRGRRLAVFQQSRFAPYFRQVREVVDSGVLGRIVLVKIRFNGFGRRWDWQTLRRMNGGSLLNTGPHPLDQALHFVGRDAMPTVACVMDRVNSFGDAEDHVKLILTRPGRPMVDLEISSCSAYSPYTYVVCGSRGSLAGTMTHIEWKYFREEEAPPQRLLETPLPNLAYCGEALPWHEEKWDVPPESKDLFGTMARLFYTNLHAHLAADAPLEVPLEQVRQQIAVIEEAHRQNRSYPRAPRRPVRRATGN
ncbi:MAG: putative oxidoreductase YdgJ [Lentisphaerae bacterium ADurb.BinA184]|nr:MAG: putative oxidoreductase YdgJ [Lentisphaerae bacterium ADurb.BinA184]